MNEMNKIAMYLFIQISFDKCRTTIFSRMILRIYSNESKHLFCQKFIRYAFMEIINIKIDSKMFFYNVIIRINYL